MLPNYVYNVVWYLNCTPSWTEIRG